MTNPAKQNIITSICGSKRQVADIKSEPRPASNRNRWPASSESAAWFKLYNRNRSYRDQVKPFNFLICFQSRPRLALSEAEECPIPKKGPSPKIRQAKPVAPFDNDVGRASANALDRDTGAPVLNEEIKSYREALAQYHLSPESKFHNGDFLDRGRTERRHIEATAIVHIGKEANKWEEQFFTGLDMDAQIEYGLAPGDAPLDPSACS